MKGMIEILDKIKVKKLNQIRVNKNNKIKDHKLISLTFLMKILIKLVYLKRSSPMAERIL